ncbi:peptidoglycan-binding domain-containing protein [Motilibacter deserti]|uniref:Peptidoglycan-binding protein n=1 Tax=Motilibacter deserti TaxID=2714956 RepID=A0ABX0GVE4_9ACTN|nr:peptidoglycan-binding domain-containing protein [Motilibacter deserti]NHC14515.1 peptidoglycan-binding protein [Motilibacter deserti]
MLPTAGARETESVAPVLPTLVPVGSRSTDYRTSVKVVAQMGPSAQVRTQASGMLTSTRGAGQAVRQGQELFTVDEVPVLAYRAAAPLFRDLHVGDKGDDVLGLERYLSRLGKLPADAVDDTFREKTVAAVKALQEERLGVRADGTFRVSYVAFLPEGVTSLGEPVAPVGSAVAAGDPVLETAPAPVSIEFRPADDGGPLTTLAGAGLVLLVGDERVPVSGLTPTAEELAGLYRTVTEEVAIGRAQQLPSDIGSTQQFSGLLLARAQAETRGVVPATAVHVSESGGQCVFVRDGDGAHESSTAGLSARALPKLEVAVGELGAAFVDAELIGAQVVRDAAAVPAQTSASCS